MNKYKLIIFDMDGTLADTSAGILQCHKYANVQMGRPEPTDEDLAGIIGGPLLKTYLTRFKFSETEAVEAVKIYREHYAKYGITNINEYEGMKEAIVALKNSGYKLAVATLKAEKFAKVILDKLAVSEYFDVVHGVDDNDKRTKTDLVNLCIEEAGVSRTQSVLVGDSLNDEYGAKEAGIDFIAVSYGFGYTKNGAAPSDSVAFIHSPVELINAVDKL